MIKKMCYPGICFLAWVFFAGPLTAIAQNTELIAPEVETARTDAYEKQLVNYLRHFLVEAYEKAMDHKLKIPERIRLILHEGGHEAIVEEGLRFMTHWLTGTINEK